MVKISRTLVLIRHAKSERPASVPDHERPLAERGTTDADRMAPLLATLSPQPGAILVSSAVRARQTIDRLIRSIAADSSAFRLCEPTVEPRLYMAEPDSIWDLAYGALLAAKTVWLCGHNPGITDTVHLLTGTDFGNVPTLGVIAIGFEELGTPRPEGRILSYLTPAVRR